MPDENKSTAGLVVSFHHAGESVTIGPDIEITYLGKPKTKPRIGIIAPKDLTIGRSKQGGDYGSMQVEAARKLYSPPDRLDVVRWSEYARELDRIIDGLLGRANPYFQD